MHLTADELAPLFQRLDHDAAAHASQFPGRAAARQPVHVVYGGAHLFNSRTPARLGAMAIDSLRTFASDPADFAECLGVPARLAESVYSRVLSKLESEPIEDYRIDFEDGYGCRGDAEEDTHAASAARELSVGMRQPHFPSFSGVRIKPLTALVRQRSIRTLQLFISTLLDATGGQLPPGFVITLPKITSREQVAVLCDVLDLFECRAGLSPGSVRIELMIETVQSILTPDGRVALPELIGAARGRCRGVHFGAYDYSADCEITAIYQGMAHPACDFARSLIQASLAGRGVMLSDSLTAVLPVAIHKGDHLSPEQVSQNRGHVRRAWTLHFADTRRSLANGFYQGWDLHPAQLPPRYAAVYSFFLEGLETVSIRLRNFIEKAARATTAGNAFDDAATGQGLLNFFLRGLNCGAVTETELLSGGLTLEELRTRSFAEIMHRRGVGDPALRR